MIIISKHKVSGAIFTTEFYYEPNSIATMILLLRRTL